jgi:hypothetical protein
MKVAGLRRELWLPTAWNHFPKASGKKGLHLYLPIAEASDQRTSGCRPASREVHKDLVVSRMDKRLLTGKVFVDWSQNRQAGAKPNDGLSGPARTSHRRQASASRVSPCAAAPSSAAKNAAESKRQAQPVDGTVAADQRGALHVADQRIVLDARRRRVRPEAGQQQHPAVLRLPGPHGPHFMISTHSVTERSLIGRSVLPTGFRVRAGTPG